MQDDLQTIFGDQAFNPYTHETASDFEPIPPGKYAVLIEKAELTLTKKGNGHYIYLALAVLDGKYKGRKIWDRLNVDNPSTKAVEIALRSLAAIVQALGFSAEEDWKNLDLWVNKVVVAHVKVRDDQNAVQTYSSPNEAQPQTGDAGLPVPTTVAVPPAAGSAVVSPAEPAAPGGTASRPWDRKAA